MASIPESAPPSRPPPAATRDLSDAEFAELGRLLAGIPEPLSPLDLDTADGFLAGLAVQPRPVDSAEWLRFVFDADGHRWGEAEPGPEQLRAAELLRRRGAAIERELAEFGGFDPYLLAAEDAVAEDDVADAAEAAADEADAVDHPAPVNDPVAATVSPWVAGFLGALDLYPIELDPTDPADAALARLDRYLEEPFEQPPGSIDAAVDEVLAVVSALYMRAEAERYRVETVRRSSAKVGRNEPCPCGSGKKFKQCHGAAA